MLTLKMWKIVTGLKLEISSKKVIIKLFKRKDADKIRQVKQN